MLQFLKARLKDERTWTVIHAFTSIAIVWATMKLGSSLGLHGSDLKTVLGGESTIAIALATLMHAPRRKSVSKDAGAEDGAEEESDAEEA